MPMCTIILHLIWSISVISSKKKFFRWDRGDIQLQAGRPWCLCSARGNSGSPGTGGVKGCTQSRGSFWGRRMILMKACVESPQGWFRRHHICVGIILDTNILYIFIYSYMAFPKVLLVSYAAFSAGEFWKETCFFPSFRETKDFLWIFHFHFFWYNFQFHIFCG